MQHDLHVLIKQQRNKLGLTQAQVAAHLGFKSADYICLVEQGLRNMDLDKIPALAEILKMNSSEVCRMALEQQYPIFSQCVLKEKLFRAVPLYNPEVRHAVERLSHLPQELRQMAINVINVLYEKESRPQRVRAA